jgi:oxygen-dependent protoporphyrinogen oxidase
VTRPPERVVVVGGGLSGLTAAFRLDQAGSDVTVVEPGPLGGKLQTSIVAGRAVDETADAFLLRVPWALALCHDLELDGELVSPVARQAEIWVDSRRRPLPAGHLMGVPTDLDALATSGVVDADAVARVAQDLDLGVLPTDPGAGPSGPDVAIGPYLRGRLGDEVVDRLIEPLVGGINAGDLDRLSLATVVPQLDAAARSDDASLLRACRAQIDRAAALAAHTAAPAGSSAPPIFATPLGGTARIIDGLVQFSPGVTHRLGRAAVAIEPTGPATSGGSTGPYRVVLDDGTTLDADAVVLALPAHALGPLLSDVAPTASATFGAVEHASIAMLTLAVERSAFPPLDESISGCLVPRSEGTLVTALSYASHKWAQLRDPARDDVLLRVSVGKAGDQRFTDLDDDALLAAVLDDLGRIAGLRGEPTDVRIGRWDRAFPQYAPGHLDRVDQTEDELAATGVRVAGMALRGVGIPACIRSAEDAAASLGATWSTRRSLTR